MQAITNNTAYYLECAENRIGAWNDRLNVLCDRFSEDRAIPTIKGVYRIAGKIAPSRLANNWYDPFSTGSILRITKIVERVALWQALKKPGPANPPHLPLYSHYLNTCLTSAAQHLYNYIKEVNFLLRLPSTLKCYTTAPSFDHFISKLPNFFGKSWVVVSKVIIGSKYLLLNFVNVVLKILEIAFHVFSLDGLFYLIKTLREVVTAASTKLSEKATQVAHEVIDRRTSEIRKELTVSIMNTVNSFTVSTLNRVLAKTVIGGAFFLGVKTVLQSTFGLSEQPIHFVGLFVLGSIVWKTVLKPTWDPYYHSYIQNFDPSISHLREFCKRYKINYWYPSLKTIQVYSREA